MSSSDPFVVALREALNHLYDYAFLRRSPLVGLFSLAARANASDALREVLQSEIEALKPHSGDVSAAITERHHELLYYRYVQRMTQHSVADQLSLSPRHLRREQEAAISTLAERLRARFTLSQRIETPLVDAVTAEVRETRRTRLDLEMAWLGDSLTGESADVKATLEDAARLAQGMASSHGVELSVRLSDALASADVAPTVLTQIVLNLLTAAIRAVAGGQVVLNARAEAGQVVIGISADIGRLTTAGAALTWDKAGVEMARRLAHLFKGTVSVAADRTSLTATVRAPCPQTQVVLAIEDNTDTLQLWRRYLQSSCYRLVSVSEPVHALEMAAKLQPGLILLDVMMPGTDGWKLIEQLRSDRATHRIPIVVCTVLPQEELALTLGASGFIRKPVTRRDFLAEIARHSHPGGDPAHT